jgi:hypothetical protein
VIVNNCRSRHLWRPHAAREQTTTKLWLELFHQLFHKFVETISQKRRNHFAETSKPFRRNVEPLGLLDIAWSHRGNGAVASPFHWHAPSGRDSSASPAARRLPRPLDKHLANVQA